MTEEHEKKIVNISHSRQGFKTFFRVLLNILCGVYYIGKQIENVVYCFIT